MSKSAIWALIWSVIVWAAIGALAGAITFHILNLDTTRYI
jgi:hypothetical protein